eukprot:756879-Hanusia_phi.AAC.5
MRYILGCALVAAASAFAPTPSPGERRDFSRVTATYVCLVVHGALLSCVLNPPLPCDPFVCLGVLVLVDK